MKSFLHIVFFSALIANGYGFLAPLRPSSGGSLSMGLFDGIMKAFGNENFASPPEGVKATARHILVKTKDEATVVMDKIAQGGSFASMASQYSTCPSKNQGGSLGSFRPGVMVPAFDKVIFDPETKLNEVVGPVMTPVRAF
jgi:peptidyl-prolyl cis-trans isomerase C